MSTGNIQGGGQRRSVDPTQTGMPQSHTQVSQELMRLAAFGDKAGRLVLRGQGDGVHFERHRHIHRQIFITGTERASTNHRVEHLLHLSGRPDLAEAFLTHEKERGDKSVRSDFVEDSRKRPSVRFPHEMLRPRGGFSTAGCRLCCGKHLQSTSMMKVAWTLFAEKTDSMCNPLRNASTRK